MADIRARDLKLAPKAIPVGSIGVTTDRSFYTWTIEEARQIRDVLSEFLEKRDAEAKEPIPA